MSRQIFEALGEEAQRLEVELDTPRLEGLTRYFETLSRWARRIRVSGASDALVLVRRHFADSLALSRKIPRDGASRCVDVGSGGGLPGLPAALLRPDLRVTLVEVNTRKCAMLRTAIHELGLGCEVLNLRLESLAMDQHGPFDVAWSLATFSPSEWLGRATALVRDGGHVIAFTARRATPPCSGLAHTETLSYALHDGTPRTMAVYRRTEP